jgi:hypothetical protein
MDNTLIDNFERLGAEIVQGHAKDTPTAAGYVQAVKNLVAGVAHWHLDASRFGAIFHSFARLTS